LLAIFQRKCKSSQPVHDIGRQGDEGQPLALAKKDPQSPLFRLAIVFSEE
jgi:hypothetical protein